MEYSAGNVSNLLWFVETRETARLLSNGTMEKVAEKIVKDNLYQQKDIKRAKRQFNMIKKRLLAIPDSLVRLITSSDINTAKLIVFIGCMATDRLLFELVYEVYRDKLFMGEDVLTDADLNIFFKNKQEQSDKVAGMSEASIKKLKQTYCKYMFETGLLTGKVTERRIVKPYIEQEIRNELQNNSMGQYLAALTGQ